MGPWPWLRQVRTDGSLASGQEWESGRTRPFRLRPPKCVPQNACRRRPCWFPGVHALALGSAVVVVHAAIGHGRVAPPGAFKVRTRQVRIREVRTLHGHPEHGGVAQVGPHQACLHEG